MTPLMTTLQCHNCMAWPWLNSYVLCVFVKTLHLACLEYKHQGLISDFKASKPEKHIVGDIGDKDELKRALQGVDTVFHTAGMISFGTHPDFEGMMKVNVYGMLKVKVKVVNLI